MKSIMYELGTKLRTPSGCLAELVRYKVKRINPLNKAEGEERVVTLRLLQDGSHTEDVDFSEDFIRRCKVIA